MIRILLIPSTDFLGHPIPSRAHHIFERLHGDQCEVHVVRINLYGQAKMKTKLIIHELKEIKVNSLLLHYGLNIRAYAKEISQIVKTNDIDVIVMCNLSPALATKLVLGDRIPSIFDLFDHLPTAATGYITDINSLLGKSLSCVFEKLLKHLLRKSQMTVTASKALLQYAKKMGAPHIAYLSNGVDRLFFKKYIGSEIRETHNIHADDILLGYIGSVEFWLDLKALVFGISKAKKNKIPVKLLILGKNLRSRYFTKVWQWIKEARIEKDVIWLNFLPYQEVPKYVAAFDLAAIPFQVNHPTAYYSNPNKLWEYFAQRKPVISTPIPEVLFIKDAVYIVRTIQDYSRVFREYYRDPEQFLESVKRGYDLALQRTWDKQATLMKSIINKIIGEYSGWRK